MQSPLVSGAILQHIPPEDSIAHGGAKRDAGIPRLVAVDEGAGAPSRIARRLQHREIRTSARQVLFCFFPSSPCRRRRRRRRRRRIRSRDVHEKRTSAVPAQRGRRVRHRVGRVPVRVEVEVLAAGVAHELQGLEVLARDVVLLTTFRLASILLVQNNII